MQQVFPISHRVVRRILWFCLAIGVLCSTEAFAVEDSLFVGTWYSEFKEAGAYGNEKYDSFRVFGRIRFDGRFSAVHRFYKNDLILFETHTFGVWGVERNILWFQCESMTARGDSYPCNELQEYLILKADESEVIYVSKKSGRVHKPIRVADDFYSPLRGMK